MFKFQFLLVGFLLTYNSLYSQEIQYGGMQQFSIRATEGGFNTGIYIVNGARFKRYFIGIGADMEFLRRNAYYYEPPPKSFAVFGDFRYYINKKKNFFAKLNAGSNLVLNDVAPSSIRNFKGFPGLYSSCGLGFKARIGKEIFYSFDLSYYFRQTRYTYSYFDYFSSSWLSTKYDLRQYAVMLNLGIEIF